MQEGHTCKLQFCVKSQFPWRLPSFAVQAGYHIRILESADIWGMMFAETQTKEIHASDPFVSLEFFCKIRTLILDLRQQNKYRTTFLTF